MKTDRLKIIFLLCSLWLVFPCFCLAAKGKDFVVVIDPGHGGHDPGAIGRRGKEKNINLNVALKVGQLIQNNCNIYPENRCLYPFGSSCTNSQ